IVEVDDAVERRQRRPVERAGPAGASEPLAERRDFVTVEHEIRAPSDRLEQRERAVEPRRIEDVVAERQTAGVQAQRSTVLMTEHDGARLGVVGDETRNVDVSPFDAPEIEDVAGPGRLPRKPNGP